MTVRTAYLQMHIAIVLWGFTAIFGKLIQLDEGLLVWYRMLITSLSLFIFLLFSGKLKLLPIKELIHIAGIGSVVALHWITFYAAIKASNVTIAISCFSSVALFTAILEPLMSKKLPRKNELFLALLVIIGIYIIFRVQEMHLKGILLSLISAFLAAVFTILNKNISTRYGPALLTFLELGTGCLILTAFLPLWFTINTSSFQLPGFSDWIYLLLLSIFCTTVAFTLSMYALRKLDAFTMNLSVNLEPLYSIILAMIIFKEKEMLNGWFLFGSVLIFGTVLLHGIAETRRRRKLEKSAGNPGYEGQ